MGVTFSQVEERRNRVKNMKMGDLEKVESPHFPSRLNVGLFGIQAVGKTSLLNSLKYAVEGSMRVGDYEQRAPAQFQGGHTKLRLQADMTQYLSFIDSRGMFLPDLTGDNVKAEIINQLEGRSSFTKVVDWEIPTETSQSLDKRIYCSVLVIDARSTALMVDAVKTLVTIIHDWQGYYPIAIITKVDRASTEDLIEMRSLLQSVGILDYYEVSNITLKKKDLTYGEQDSLLKFIEQCFKYGDRTFKFRHAIDCGE